MSAQAFVLRSVKVRNNLHAALYPERYGHPRLWAQVPWPQRHAAFNAWFAGTNLNRLQSERPLSGQSDAR